METEDQHKSRLAEEAQKEARLKAEAADKEKKEKEKVEKEKEKVKAEHKQENLMKGSLTLHPPLPPSQLGSHSFTPFVPNSPMGPPQNNDPNNVPPRSPQYSRQMPNGNSPCSQGGQNGGSSMMTSPLACPIMGI
jgi:hypothetical protein